jgi:hypothetical protein
MKVQASPARKSYVRFNVANVGTSVLKATLKVYAPSSAGSTGVSARGIASTSWGENTLTHNNAPALGEELSRTGTYSAGWVDFDVTAQVKGDGLVSVGVSTTSTTKRTFSTRESTTPPQLVVQTSDTTAPPPTTTPPPPASGSSLFSASGYLNSPLASNAALDPQSAGAVNDLLGMVAAYPEGINTSSWTTRVYTVPLSQPTVRVVNDNAGHPALGEAYSAVPLPAGAQADPQADQHLTVWQPSSDTLWEFWGFSYDSSGVPHARYGGRMGRVSTNPGHFIDDASPFQDRRWGATATSIPLLAGLIRYSEAQALNIPHALALAVPKSNCQSRNPAQRTDGACTPAVSYLPPGARLRLPASLDTAALACSPLCKAIAKAVQNYGFVIRDRAGANMLQGENTGADWNTTIPGGKSLTGFPWDKLQMLPPSVD